MPRHCGACTHPKRAEIDRQLILGQLSLSALGRQYELSPATLRAHRSRHLEELVAALRAAPDAWTLPQVYAQAGRLYEIAKTALADAQRGKVVGVDADGQPVRKVSSLEVSRLIGEAREALELKHRIAEQMRDREQNPRARG